MGTIRRALTAAAVGALFGVAATAGVMWLGAARPASMAPESAPARTAPPPDPAAVAQREREALAAVIEQVEVEAPPRGTGTIAGHVRTKDGAPVAGAVVRAYAARAAFASAPGRPDSGRPEPTVAERVREFVIRAKTIDVNSRTATSDATGSYVLTELPDAGHFVFAQANDYAVRHGPDDEAHEVKPGATVDFVAAPLVAVPFKVLRPDGASPVEASVQWKSVARGGGSGHQTWTAADPVLELEPGTWELTVSDGAEWRSAPVRTTVEVGNPVAPVDARIVERRRVRGTIRLDPADVGLRDLNVSLERHVDVDESVDPSRRPRGASVRVETRGTRFRSDELPPGDYDLSLTAGQGALKLATELVHVADGALDHDLVIPRLSPAQLMRVRVTAPDGNPVSEDDVTFAVVLQRANGFAQSRGARVVGVAEGTLILTGTAWPSTGDGTDGRVILEARSSLYGINNVEYVPGTTASAEIHFGEPARVETRIVGAKGQPIESRLSVSLYCPGPPAGWTQRADLVEPGRYVAVLWLVPVADSVVASGRRSDRRIAAVSVDLRSGWNRPVIRVPPLFALTVRVPGAARGTQVTLRRPFWFGPVGPSGPSRPTDPVDVALSCPTPYPEAPLVGVVGDDETATISELPAGRYAMTVGDKAPVFVTVPAAGVVTYAPTYKGPR